MTKPKHPLFEMYSLAEIIDKVVDNGPYSNATIEGVRSGRVKPSGPFKAFVSATFGKPIDELFNV